MAVKCRLQWVRYSSAVSAADSYKYTRLADPSRRMPPRFTAGFHTVCGVRRQYGRDDNIISSALRWLHVFGTYRSFGRVIFPTWVHRDSSTRPFERFLVLLWVGDAGVATRGSTGSRLQSIDFSRLCPRTLMDRSGLDGPLLWYISIIRAESCYIVYRS